MKKCRRCGDSKGPELFPRNSKAKDGRGSYCLSCMSAYACQYRYGITRERYESMMVRQGDSCAICRVGFSDTVKPRVDRDHNCCKGRVTCGKCVRGLLCKECSTLAGLIETRFKTLTPMFNYLRYYIESFNASIDEDSEKDTHQGGVLNNG